MGIYSLSQDVVHRHYNWKINDDGLAIMVLVAVSSVIHRDFLKKSFICLYHCSPTNDLAYLFHCIIISRSDRAFMITFAIAYINISIEKEAVDTRKGVYIGYTGKSYISKL